MCPGMDNIGACVHYVGWRSFRFIFVPQTGLELEGYLVPTRMSAYDLTLYSCSWQLSIPKAYVPRLRQPTLGVKVGESGIRDTSRSEFHTCGRKTMKVFL